MIFQEPMTALNPLYTVGNQIVEVLELHEGLRGEAARARAVELLHRTGLPDAPRAFDAYPHQLSGGQRQRAMIAMALACGPKLLIADEPTTALDVTIQAQILALLDRLQAEMGLALLFITHDLNLVRRFSHRVGVMERGRLVEMGDTAAVFAAPRHAYTRRLLASRPQRVVHPVATDAPVLIADEPTTALDVTIQAQILELLANLRADFDSSVILITHDLGVVAEVADEIIVMYAGRVVERGSKRDVFYDPQHPYTWGLLGSIPRLDRPKPKKLHSIEGTPPSLINLPRGCKFRPRCPHAFEKCQQEPELKNRVEARGHLDRCWLSVDEKRGVRERDISGEARVVA